MAAYKIFTDSGCDIPKKTLTEWGVGSCSLTYTLTDPKTGESDGHVYLSEELPYGEFYQKMRDGFVPKTAAPASELFYKSFMEVLDSGADVIHLAMSSAISGSYNSARDAAARLEPLYPNRRIIVIDTLCASAGEGLLVYLTSVRKSAGASLEEAEKFVHEEMGRIAHWFTVDDLTYLKRGGRISPAAAFVGGVLGIRPVLHVNDAGALENVEKVRGRRASLVAMAKRYSDTVTDRSLPVIITNADTPEDGEFLRKEIVKAGAENVMTFDHGPTTGAHAGPGTIALFFEASVR